jgi:thioredoxin reductase
MHYDAVIVGGGPAGLAAALALGRARRHVLLCDAGPRRNAAASHVHNFVTRDGTPPAEFRRIGREQLAPYRNVELCDEPITAIRGERGDFTVTLPGDTATARAILLCTGMIDELPPLPGLAPLWGTSAFICPYCHGWEVQDRRFGYLATSVERLPFALMLKCWTDDVVVFTDGKLAVPADVAAQLAGARVRIETRPLARLHATDGRLARVELADGESIERDVLFLHPHQRQVPLVQSLGLALDAAGYVVVDDHRATSVPGIYAAGDLITPVQSAIFAASSAVMAASTLNLTLAIADARPATPPG